MKICVINGSPKGQYSITLQTVRYLEKKFPSCEFHVLDVGQKIVSFEKDMTKAGAELNWAEVVLFSYPVYTFLAPSQLHRFIRALKESHISLEGKYATQLTTSKHFYDITAHRYLEDNCHDLGMRVIHGLSADMEDLTTKKGQADAVAFWKYVMWCVEQGICETPQEASAAKTAADPAQKKSVDCIAEEATVGKSGTEDGSKESNRTVALVADLAPEDEPLREMMEEFERVCPCKVRLVNLAEYPFKGGCISCFHCAADGKCIYKDGFDTFLREEIQTADAIVYAFSIVDHSMGPRFKTYDDRQFCNGHRTVTEGMPFGYLIHGDYAKETNLQNVIEARCQVGHNFLAGAATSAEEIRSMSQRLVYAMQNNYVPPRNFWGVGGMKIFRDLIWIMQGLMKADHEFYKKRGIYDFPQKKKGQMIMMYAVGTMFRNPKIRSKMGNKMNEGMIAPYRKVIAEATSEE